MINGAGAVVPPPALSPPRAETLAAFDLQAATDPAAELCDLESETFSVAALRDWLAERGAPWRIRGRRRVRGRRPIHERPRDREAEAR